MTTHPANTYSLVADIGGTNTRVALAKGATLIPETITRYKNAEHASLGEVLQGYIADQGNVDCAKACIAVAGPVRDGVGKLTNLDWAMDTATLQRAAQAEKVAILNDLQAQGHALGHIDPANISEIIPGPEGGERAARLVIGVGTGFNAAVVFDTGSERLVPPSEAGHTDLATRRVDDLKLFEFIEKQENEYPAIDSVLSGRGLEHIYHWHSVRNADGAHLKAADIMAAMNAGTDPIAELAVATFVRLLGSVVGDLALTYLPFGGIYLIGGVARATSPHFAKHGFDHAFRDKGRFGEFMDNFALSLIEDDWAALIGCARHINS